jgi:hypothetical protein
VVLDAENARPGNGSGVVVNAENERSEHGSGEDPVMGERALSKLAPRFWP